MDITPVLYGFLELAAEDPRIGPAHISLFTAILQASIRQGGREPVSVYGRDLMKQAKIGGVATYHRCLKDLRDYGYIRYVPSYNPVLGSLVYLTAKT